MSAPRRGGEAGGGGGSFLPLQTWQPLQLPATQLLSKCLSSTSSKQAPPARGREPGRATVPPECVKQWPAGFPGKRSGTGFSKG